MRICHGNYSEPEMGNHINTMDNTDSLLLRPEGMPLFTSFYVGDTIAIEEFFVKFDEPRDRRITLSNVMHPNLQREGEDLRTILRLSLREALLGWQRSRSWFDERVLNLFVNGLTSYT